MTQETTPLLRRRLLVVGLCTVAALAVVIAVALVAQRAALKRLEASFETRGIGLSFERSGISWRGAPSLYNACFSLLDDGHDDLCAERVEAQLHTSSLRDRRPRLRRGDVHGLRIQTSLARITAFRTQNSDERTSEQAPSSASGVLQDLEALRVHDATFDLNALEARLRGQLQDLALTQDEGWRVSGSLLLEDIESASPAPRRLLREAVGNRVELDARLESLRELQAATVHLERPMVARVRWQDRDHALRLQTIEFRAPWTIRIPDLGASVDDGGAQLALDALTVEMGTWTRDLRQLYITALRLDAPHLYVAKGSARSRLGALIQAFRGAPASDGAAAELADTTLGAEDTLDSAEEDSRASGEPSALQSALTELRARAWHDLLPRSIVIEGGRLALVEELPEPIADGAVLDALTPLLSVDDVALRYGLRVLHRQLDLSLSAAIASDEGPAGTVQAQGVWNYERKRGEISLDVNAESLAPVRPLLRRIGLDVLEGNAQGRASFSGSKRDGAVLKVDATIAPSRMSVARLSSPLQTPEIKIETEHSLQRQEDSGWRLQTEKSQLQIGGAKLSLQFDVTGISLNAPHPFERMNLQLEVPDQEPMQLLNAVPKALLGPIDGTQLSGTYGLSLHFDIVAKGVDETQRPLWEILAPSKAQVRDSALRLVSLPEAVDVRRLNGPMRFTFRGPQDSMMRPLQLAPPLPSQSYPKIHQTLEGDVPPRWVRLSEMSFPLVATQLYREDISFFTNTGINWFQLRNVLSEALTTGRLSRGASTISMQLVKNVFLSHERSIERKLQELFLTYWLTRLVPKERILEVYMNVIELGPNLNGFEEASLFYFGMSSRELPVTEATWLSSISPNPTRISGGRYRGSIEVGSCVRCERLISALVTRGWLRESERPRANEASPDGLGLSAGASGVNVVQVSASGANQSPQTLPDLPLNLNGLWEPPSPLLEILEEPLSTSAHVSRLAQDERVQHWIQSSRQPRGAGPSP